MLQKLENVMSYHKVKGVAGLLRQSSTFSMTCVYQRTYSTRPSVRLHRRYTKLKRMKDNFEAKEKWSQEDRYRKGQLDPKPSTSSNCG